MRFRSRGTPRTWLHRRSSVDGASRASRSSRPASRFRLPTTEPTHLAWAAAPPTVRTWSGKIQLSQDTERLVQRQNRINLYTDPVAPWFGGAEPRLWHRWQGQCPRPWPEQLQPELDEEHPAHRTITARTSNCVLNRSTRSTRRSSAVSTPTTTTATSVRSPQSTATAFWN